MISWYWSWCSIQICWQSHSSFGRVKIGRNGLLANQIILKNRKSFCVLIPPIFFLHISLVCLITTNMSDIENRMFLLYAYNMIMTIRTLKGKLVLLMNYYYQRLLKTIYFKTKIIWVSYLSKCN